MNDPFLLSAAQLEQLTAGRVGAKTASNWENADQWFSPIQKHRRGKPRRFSRINAIEAVIASELMLLGLTRSSVKQLMSRRFGKQVTRTQAARQFEELEAYRVGSNGWFMVLGGRDNDGKRTFDTYFELNSSALEHLARTELGHPDGPRTASVIPISKLIENIDAMIATLEVSHRRAA